MKWLPPQGSTTLHVPLSCWMTSCVFRAMRAEKSGEGDCFIQRIRVERLRMPLRCGQRLDLRAGDIVEHVLRRQDQPDFWQWVRRLRARWSRGLNGFMSFAHSKRAARILAISM